jgi:hypothetical protein
MRPQVKSTIILSGLGLSLALNAAMAIGQLRGSAQRKDSPAARRAGEEYCLLDQLELDAEQQRLLAEMRRRMHKKRGAYWQSATAIKVELADAICAAPADRAALDAQLERYAKNQAAMQRGVAEHLLGVNAMLRPEQREGFRRLLRTQMFRGIRSSRGKPAGAP